MGMGLVHDIWGPFFWIYQRKNKYITVQSINAILTGLKIVVPTQNDADSLSQDGYGTRNKGLLILQPFEALYLVEKERLTIIDEQRKKNISFQELLNISLETDPLLWTKYIIYRDIRGRGFVTKETGEKGVSFIVYERGCYKSKPPSYYVYTVYEGMPETIGHLKEILEQTKVSSKELKLAVVDRRGEIVYYSLNEINFDNLLLEYIN